MCYVRAIKDRRKSIVTATVGNTVWGSMKWFDVQKMTNKNAFDVENTDR
jgi:4-hydroxy-3-methylbut-2-en-1-yl diphosphate synthase IspG/GcpE